MPLIRNGKIVADTWRLLEDGEDIPAGGDVILSLERIHKDAELLAARTGRTGVAIENSVDPAELDSHLAHLNLIALEFPAFTDGRAYSQARRLRVQFGYSGELRATGNVLADQAAFLKQVGFDSFDLAGGQSLDVWNASARAITLAYQRGYGGGQATREIPR